MGLPYSYGPSATVDRAGRATAAMYRESVGLPPTDPTVAISTAGASGSYSEATVLTVPSSIDPSITDLGYKRCHDTGHAAPGKLVPVLRFAGFNQSGISQFTTAEMRRIASYVGPTGLAPLVVAADGRGRGGRSGTIDYRRDRQDRRDCLAHAVAAVGASNIWDGGTVVIGLSTGCLDAALYACTFPGEVAVLVLIWANFDLGHHPRDSYWAIQGAAQRAYLTTSVGSLATRTAAALDPYLVINMIDALPRIVGRPGGPPVFILAHETDTPAPDRAGSVPLPDHARLIAAMRANRAAASRTHVFVTTASDAAGVQVPHDSGSNSDGAILAERRYFPAILSGEYRASALPPESPPDGFRVLGRLVGPDWDLWTGPTAAPKTTTASGGRSHAGELRYRARAFDFTADTSTNGHVQILTDEGDDRDEAFTAGSPVHVDLDVTPTISALSDLGVTDAWFSDAGTAGVPLTSWTAEIGGRVLAPIAGEEPTVATVAGKSTVQFTRVSVAVGKRLSGAYIPIVPTGNFTWFICYSMPAATTGQIAGLTHQGSYHAITYGTSSGQDIIYSRSSVYAQLATTNQNGIGGHAHGTGALRTAVVRRKDGVLSTWLEMGQKSESVILSARDDFSSSGTFHLTLGAGLADSGNPAVPFEFNSVDFYGLAFAPRALSEAECHAVWALYQARFY